MGRNKIVADIEQVGRTVLEGGTKNAMPIKGRKPIVRTSFWYREFRQKKLTEDAKGLLYNGGRSAHNESFVQWMRAGAERSGETARALRRRRRVWRAARCLRVQRFVTLTCNPNMAVTCACIYTYIIISVRPWLPARRHPRARARAALRLELYDDAYNINPPTMSSLCCRSSSIEPFEIITFTKNNNI